MNFWICRVFLSCGLRSSGSPSASAPVGRCGAARNLKNLFFFSRFVFCFFFSFFFSFFFFFFCFGFSFAFIACSGSGDSSSLSWREHHGLVLTTDFTTSSVDIFSLDDPSDIENTGIVASGDAVIRLLPDHTPVILNRGADSNIMILNSELEVVQQIALPFCGPHDIATSDNITLVITCYEQNKLLLVNKTLGLITETIELSTELDSDGKLELDAVTYFNGSFYISLQHLNRSAQWQPERSGSVWRFNNDFSERQDINLPCKNPITSFARIDSLLYLGCAGDLSKPGEAALTAVDTTTLTASLLKTETELSGAPLSITADNNDLYLLVSVPESSSNPFTTRETKALHFLNNTLTEIYSTEGFTLSGISAKNQTVYFGYRDTPQNSGLYVWQSTNIQGPMKTSLPPYESVVW